MCNDGVAEKLGSQKKEKFGNRYYQGQYSDSVKYGTLREECSNKSIGIKKETD